MSERHLLRQASTTSTVQVMTIVSPFTNTYSPPWYWRLVEGLVGVTLFPLRLVVLGTTVLMTIIFVIPLLKLSNACKCGPCVRKLCLLPLRLVCRIVLWCFGYWWISFKRREGYAKNPRILLANHTALIDAIYMTYAFAPMPVAKAGVRKIPIAGVIAESLQAIFVDRKSKTSREDTLLTIKKRTAPDSGFPPMMIYPEGTTTNGKVLVQFKKGAFAPGMPVQPIVLRYRSTFLNPAAVGDMSGLAGSFIRQMLQPYMSLSVTLLPSVTPSVEEQANPREYAKRVRALFATEMNVPVTEHSYEDVYLSMEIQKLGENIEQDFEAKKLRELFGLSFDELKARLRAFHEADIHRSGVIHLDDFCETLGLSSEDARAQQIFHWFDEDDTGTINFCEFVRAASILSKNCTSKRDRLRLAFLSLDANGDGWLDLAELKDHLKAHRQHYADSHEVRVSNLRQYSSSAPLIDAPSPASSSSIRSESMAQLFSRGSDEDIAEIKRTGRISFGQFERCIGEDGANLEQIGISLALKRIPEKIAAEMNAEDD